MSTAEELPKKMHKEEMMEKVERLIWNLLDQQIDEGDAELLQQMISENPQLRGRYEKCAQIHADLYSHYGANQRARERSPVLSSLGGSIGVNNPSLTD